MARRAWIHLLAALALLIAVKRARGADAASDRARPIVLAHYLPWYASRPVSGRWGWHWTMNRFDPDRPAPKGQLRAASHDEPLLGFYDSSDPAVLECQVLMMKLAGLDGVIVDWYGHRDFNDYALIHRNTLKLIPWLKRAGLRFAVCYEDQSVGAMARGGFLAPGAATAHGREVMGWLARNWFRETNYLKLDGRPVLLVFGPQFFEREAWQTMLRDIEPRPLWFALPHLAGQAGADGRFGWPPVSGGRVIPPHEWRAYLDRLYAADAAPGRRVAVAFPGFRDVYQEAGLHDSYGRIDYRDGRTFEETLDRALESDARLVQIATWNDYGEGTTIEPARRYGFSYLEALQRRRRKDAGFAFTSADLRLPLRLRELRADPKRGRDHADALDAVSRLLFAGRCQAARARLAELAADRNRP